LSLLLLTADPRTGSAGTLRTHAGRLDGRTCLMVTGGQPVALDLDAMLAAHRDSGALLTIAVRSRGEGDGSDALIAGDDGRLVAVQPAPHPDEALSDLADAGVYAISPGALDHVSADARELAGDVLAALLAWDAPVHVHAVDA